MNIAEGVKSGIGGIFTAPVHEAKKGGVGGFFKGVGKGLVGAVVKPVVGVTDSVVSVVQVCTTSHNEVRTSFVTGVDSVSCCWFVNKSRLPGAFLIPFTRVRLVSTQSSFPLGASLIPCIWPVPGSRDVITPSRMFFLARAYACGARITCRDEVNFVFLGIGRFSGVRWVHTGSCCELSISMLHMIPRGTIDRSATVLVHSRERFNVNSAYPDFRAMA